MNTIFNRKTIIKSIFIVVSTLFINQTNVYSQETFEDLLTVDPRGGTVLRFPAFDLTKNDAVWSGWFNKVMYYVPNVYDTYGCYEANGSANFQESYGLALKPNRTYIISALIRTNFKNRSACEVSMFINEWNSNKKKILIHRPFGVPGKTEQTDDGWMRFEVEYTTSGMKDATLFTFNLNLYGAVGGPDALFQIADVALVELPEKPLIAYASGEGVKFPGGPGKIPIKVESATDSDDTIVVVTTAAEYIFDKINSTIEARQRIDMKRPMARWTSSVRLENLSILSQDDTVAILTNSSVTFGIQCDGLLMISPQIDVDLTLESLIGGKWNRLRDGYLMVQDDFGGMTVHPAIPAGTGRIPRFTALDELDFIDFVSGAIPPGSKDNLWKTVCDDRLSQEEPGWRVQWKLSPGERLGFSVSPVRPFDWEESFNGHTSLFGGWNNSSGAIAASPANIYTLWEDTERTYGGSFGWINPKDTSATIEHVNLLHSEGKKVLSYMSAYFYMGRNPDEFIDNVREWKEDYNIDGIYSDGLPAEWLVGYKEMRMLRELFPDGYLQIHETGVWANGGAPLAASDYTSPFISAYADATITAEATTPTDPYSPEWTYARYMGTKFRQGNSPIGIIKGGYWKLSQLNVAKIALVYGGRAWIDLLGPNEYKSSYLPLLNQLRDLWLQKGDDPYFYDRFYLPKAQSITGYKLGRAGMPIVSIKGQIPGTITISLRKYLGGATIRYTTDETEPTALSDIYTTPLEFTSNTTLKTRSFEDGLDPSRVLTVEINSNTEELDDIANRAVDSFGEIYPNPVGLNEQVTIVSGSDKISEISITDLKGRIIYTNSMQTQFISNPEGMNLKAGFYLVKIATEGRVSLKKLIIQ